MRIVVTFMLIATVGLSSCQSGTMRFGGSSISRACSYLWDQQQKDGAWHSDTHALMESGQALTPFVLWTLLAVPDSLYAKDPVQIQLGLDYLRRQVDQYGQLGIADSDLLEYPNYSSAYALMVLNRYGKASDSLRVHRLQQYLVSQQFTEARGINPQHLTYGGWGFGERLQWGEHGQVDLSHTRRVLQALSLSGYDMERLRAGSLPFLSILQKDPRDQRSQPALLSDTFQIKYDGGFYYSPVILGANKGQQDLTGQFNSYPTATCDGYLALSVFSSTTESQQSALRWLEAHPSWKQWEGLDQNAQVWARAMQYYHIMARTEVYLQAQHSGPWVHEIPHWLGQQQRMDGSFINFQGAISKEDDPLLATAMALMALNNSRLATVLGPV